MIFYFELQRVDNPCIRWDYLSFISLWFCMCTQDSLVLLFQDNVFVTVVASIQYRALAEKASDAFYKLSNTKAQIQSYVFDGRIPYAFS